MFLWLVEIFSADWSRVIETRTVVAADVTAATHEMVRILGPDVRASYTRRRPVTMRAKDLSVRA